MEIAGLQINMMMQEVNRFRIKLLVLLTSERSCSTSIATHRLLHFIIILLIKFILTKNIVVSIYLEHPLPHAIIIIVKLLQTPYLHYFVAIINGRPLM